MSCSTTNFDNVSQIEFVYFIYWSKIDLCAKSTQADPSSVKCPAHIFLIVLVFHAKRCCINSGDPYKYRAVGVLVTTVVQDLVGSEQEAD